MDRNNNIMRDSLALLAGKSEAMGLPFMLVGGNALIHYGLPRFTRDIDFLVPETSVQAWLSFLEAEGLVCYHRTGAFLQFDGQASGMAPVDLMIVGMDTWNKLLEAARREVVADGFAIWVPSPVHLIAMKLQAYRNPNRSAREQDWSDILHLVRRFIPDISAREFHDLVQRHGGEPAYARLQRDIAPDQP